MLLLDTGANGFRVRSWLGIDDRLVSAVEPQGNGHYRFFDTQPGSSEPVAWNPCEPIHYVVNPDGAPDGWENLVDDAVDEVSTAPASASSTTAPPTTAASPTAWTVVAGRCRCCSAGRVPTRCPSWR